MGAIVIFEIRIVSTIRFALSGAYHKKTRGMFCLFDALTGFRDDINAVKKAKYFENMWYTLWHTSASTFGTMCFLEESWREEIFSGE